MFCLYTSSKLFHPQFEFSLKIKVMGSNPGYLLEYFLLYRYFFSFENIFEIFTSKHDESFFATNQIVYFISKILEIVRIPLNQFTEEKIGH